MLNGVEVLKAVGLEPGELDLLVGGTPCQGFSKAGKREVMDPRNSLVFEYAGLITEMMPKSIVMENVPGVVLNLSGGVNLPRLMLTIATKHRLSGAFCVIGAIASLARAKIATTSSLTLRSI